MDGEGRDEIKVRKKIAKISNNWERDINRIKSWKEIEYKLSLPRLVKIYINDLRKFSNQNWQIQGDGAFDVFPKFLEGVPDVDDDLQGCHPIHAKWSFNLRTLLLSLYQYVIIVVLSLLFR